jgi:hypothetical protein
MDLSYNYGSPGYIATQTNNLSSGHTQTYTYDALNRLLTAQSSATSGQDCWALKFPAGPSREEQNAYGLLLQNPQRR